MSKKKHDEEKKDHIEMYQAELIPEEFPEGPFGSSIKKDEKKKTI